MVISYEKGWWMKLLCCDDSFKMTQKEKYAMQCSSFNSMNLMLSRDQEILMTKNYLFGWNMNLKNNANSLF